MARAKRHFLPGHVRHITHKNFVEGIKEKLGIRAKGRKVDESGGLYHFGEAQVPYNMDFIPKNSGLGAKNTYFWG